MENGGRLATTTAGHGLSLPVSSSQVSRKEWKRGNEHVSCDVGSQEQERMKLTQSDERTIYEVQQGAGNLHADLASVAIDSSRVNGDPLQQRLQDIIKQREELQHMEVEVRARLIVTEEVMDMQKNFESQVKDHVDAYSKLKEEFQEREKHIHNLEKNIESKERELRAIKLDNEKAWAKEDLLREQNIELATFRRERDNSDAERAQFVAQIHELKAHLQEKERQSLELEEQNRVAQETILYKDGQLRDLQAWIARIQEVDAFQTTANHSLQAELRERTDQYNQLWLGFQRRVTDMERHHFQTVHQLQAELAEARERGGIFSENGKMTSVGDKDSSQHVQQVGNQFDVKDDTGSSSTIVSNANAENAGAFDPPMNISPKIDHTPGVTIPSSSVFGMSNLIPTGHVTTLHPYVIHQQDLTQAVASANSHMPQAHMGNFGHMPIIDCTHYALNQQAVVENSMPSNTDQQLPPSQIGPSPHGSPMQFGYQPPAEGRATPASSLASHHDTHQAPAAGISGSNDSKQVLDPNDVDSALQDRNRCIQEASDFNDSSLNVSTPIILEEKKTEQETPPQGDVLKERDQSSQIFPQGRAGFLENNYNAKADQVSVGEQPRPGSQSSGNDLEPTLMDERSLLACIVRAIPARAGGRIRISATLPNRLAKMLYPLHWHDYKKKYGKLDDFVACHPELFVVDGDFIHLREGAQAIISATTAVAKVAAAAASASASLPCVSAGLSTVSITPTAQIHGVKKVSSFMPKSGNDFPYPPQNGVQSVSADVSGDPSHLWAVQKPELPGSVRSNMRILSNRKDVSAQNGYPKEVKLENSVLPERRGASTGGKHIGRVPVAGFSSKS